MGSFVAALFVYFLNYEAIHKYDPELTLKSAGIFAQPWLSALNSVLDSVYNTMLFIIVVSALFDKKNTSMPLSLSAVIVGILLFTSINCCSLNQGDPGNSARDFAPRLASLTLGYTTETFTTGSYCFLVPLFCPLLGAALGCLVYYLFVSNHFPDEN